MSAAADSFEPGLPLRVALLWNGALQAEELLARPREVKLGQGSDALFTLPEGVSVSDEVTVFTVADAAYVLQPVPGLGGFVCVDGERRPAEALRTPQPLGPRDYGVVTLGNLALFFQHARAASPLTAARRERDPAVLVCLGLSVFLHLAAFVFFFVVASKEFAPTEGLELNAELVKRFMVVPPPLDEPAARRRLAKEDSERGLHDRDDAGGKKAEQTEGKLGKPDSVREATQLAGEPHDAVAAKVRGLGLLGVLSGGGANQPLQSALAAPALDKVLGGLGAAQTVIGRGSGGLGLRGPGPGGGGTASGALFGAGELGTGVAAGSGKGKGRGGGGPGVPEAKAKEAQLSLDDSGAKVHGFLSKEQIERVVRANQAAIKYCFESEMQHQPKLAGAVHMNWRIDVEGRVTVARVAKSTLGNSRVEGCMARQIKRWVFPKPDGGEVDVTYPFLLRGG